MKTYTLKVSGNMVFEATLEIESDDELSAIDKAYEMCDNNQVEWTAVTGVGDFEVIEIDPEDFDEDGDEDGE